MANNKDFQQIVSLWVGLISGKACYLPGLGPVYSSGEPLDKVLIDILDNAEVENFLDYDKNKRWYKKKQERIVISQITYGDDWLCVPTFNAQGGQLKIHFYSDKALDATKLDMLSGNCEKHKQEGETRSCSILSFIRPSADAIIKQYNIYLKTISETDQLPVRLKEIFYYNELNDKIKATFALLGEEPEMDGFSFLNEQLVRNADFQSSIACLIRDDAVIGAIGPLDVFEDGFGMRWLLPPYFGVKEQFRGKDCGERLWKEAVSHAFIQGARYTLVQNAPNSLAAQFYEKQGLEKAGEVYVSNVKI